MLWRSLLFYLKATAAATDPCFLKCMAKLGPGWADHCLEGGLGAEFPSWVGGPKRVSRRVGGARLQGCRVAHLKAGMGAGK